MSRRSTPIALAAMALLACSAAQAEGIAYESPNFDVRLYGLIDATLGATCLPWFWENLVPYDRPEWKTPAALEQPHPPCAPLPPRADPLR